MPALTIYKLRSRFDGQPITNMGQYVDLAGKHVSTYGPVQGPGFEAMLHVSDVHPHAPPWGTFLREGFGEEVTVPNIASAGALILLAVKFKGGQRYFAIPFGTNGRFLLRPSAPEAAYGVRTALNLIYPSASAAESDSRLIGIDAKRHGLETVRSRLQSSRATEPETFDLDMLRDMLNAATGRPDDQEKWGPRVHGGDGLWCSPDVAFADLGQLCKDLESAHSKTDYRTRFPWFDHIKPVSDPDRIDELDSHVLGLLKSREFSEFDIAPPQIVNWEEVTGFRYTSDKVRLTHPEMRLRDFIGTFGKDLDELSRERLSSIRARALDSDGRRVHEWAAWKCLTGSFALNERTYVLDEGNYYVVAGSFMEEMDRFLEKVAQGPVLPEYRTDHEDENAYNHELAAYIEGSILLHTKPVKSPQRGSLVEVCDVLTPVGELIHVKRELGSRDLNHLFSQGANSAEMLQEGDFRAGVREVIKDLSPSSDLDALLPEDGFSPSSLNVCFGVVADWRDRSLPEALPFFAKLSMRRAVRDLINRGFKVSWSRIEGPGKAAQKSKKPKER